MNITKTMSLCALSFAVMAGMAAADLFEFVNSGADQNWTNVNNWVCSTKDREKGLPGAADEARIGNATVRI
ncbi:MAG: hypothetical protein MUC65_03965, partial [Pontiellaceae bacterium]|nr:hypothetical protein [Pontiellaceae bacterium]